MENLTHFFPLGTCFVEDHPDPEPRPPDDGGGSE